MKAGVISVKEAMDELGVSRNAILSLIKNNQVKAVQVGTVWRIFRESFDTYIENNTNVARNSAGNAANDQAVKAA